MPSNKGLLNAFCQITGVQINNLEKNNTRKWRHGIYSKNKYYAYGKYLKFSSVEGEMLLYILKRHYQMAITMYNVFIHMQQYYTSLYIYILFYVLKLYLYLHSDIH